MDPQSAAEALPALYRALLDRVAQFDANGQRPAGLRLRAEATRIYSRAWDDRARRALEALLQRSDVAASARPQSVQRAHRRGAPVV